MQKKSLSIILFFLLVIVPASAQRASEHAPVDFKRYVAKGNSYYAKGNNVEALESFIKAEGALKDKTPREILSLKRSIADTYSLLSNFGEALGYYREALRLAEDLKSHNDRSGILNNIGLLYAWEKNSEMAISYFKQAYAIANQYELPGYVRMQIAANLAHMYNAENNFTLALSYLDQVSDLPVNGTARQMWSINYAESLLLKGQVSEAKKITEGLLNNAKVKCYVCINELLSKIYFKENDFPKAINFAVVALNNASSLTEKIDLYQHTAKVFKKWGNHDMAFTYKDSVLWAKERLTSEINAGLYESNKVKFRVQEFQNKLKDNENRRKSERNLYIVSIIFISVIAFIALRWIKNRQKHERKLAANKMKIFDLEMESLKNNIAEKNRKLSTKALYLSGRNELIEEVINALSNISEVRSNKQVSDYISTLKGYLKSDGQWDEFIEYFEQANPNFIKILTEKHPQLNTADIRFICYILMNLDIREISTIFNITINAATKRKRRIMEKMGIDKEVSLYNYLTKLT